MVDTQAVDQVLFNQLEDFAMGGFKDCRAFYAQTSQFIDIEKSPPVDVVGRRTPTGQSIRLALQQLMQAGKAFGMA